MPCVPLPLPLASVKVEASAHSSASIRAVSEVFERLARLRYGRESQSQVYIGPAARRLIHEREPALNLAAYWGVRLCHGLDEVWWCHEQDHVRLLPLELEGIIPCALRKKWSLRAREQLRCFEILGRTPWLPLPWLPLKGREKGGWRIERRQHETLQQESCSRRKWPFYSEQQG